MNPQEQYSLITQNLQEIVGEKELKAILGKGKTLKIYWGTAPTGAPHFGYFVPMLKVADFLQSGCDVTILFADIHAVLDNLKSTFEVVSKRTEYYEFLIREMLKLVGVPLEKLHFIKGSDYQFKKEYTKAMYKLTTAVTISKAKHAGADVVKQAVDPLISGLLYPLLQSLDEEFLKCDVQFGGVDQRKIFMLAREVLPKLKYKKRIHLMNPLIPGLTKSGKMSSSIPNSKIDFFDDDQTIKMKILNAYSVEGKIENNCLLCILKYILWGVVKKKKGKVVINKIEYEDYKTAEKSFEEKKITSAHLKEFISVELIDFIAPLRKVLYENKQIYERAYGKMKVKKTENIVVQEKKNVVQEEKKGFKWMNIFVIAIAIIVFIVLYQSRVI